MVCGEGWKERWRGVSGADKEEQGRVGGGDERGLAEIRNT